MDSKGQAVIGSDQLLVGQVRTGRDRQQQIVTSGGQARTCGTGEDRQRQPGTGRDRHGQEATGRI
jgi:hypothetical protein